MHNIKVFIQNDNRLYKNIFLKFNETGRDAGFSFLGRGFDINL
jgi:hypothetical protein